MFVFEVAVPTNKEMSTQNIINIDGTDNGLFCTSEFAMADVGSKAAVMWLAAATATVKPSTNPVPQGSWLEFRNFSFSFVRVEMKLPPRVVRSVLLGAFLFCFLFSRESERY